MVRYYTLKIFYGTDPGASAFQYVALSDALRMLAAFVEDGQCRRAELLGVAVDEPLFRYVRGGYDET